MIKSKSLITVLISLFFPAVYAGGDSCLQMSQAHWQGTYAWTYRGDDYQKPATANTSLSKSYKHYTMIIEIQDTPTFTLELNGTCMNNQIYFDDLSPVFPTYLQGTINDGQITLTGQRGPDVLSITLNREFL